MHKSAAEWLRNYLQKFGPCEVHQIRSAAKTNGYTRGEISAAKNEIGVAVNNNWSREHPLSDRWYWSLPEGEG